MAPVSLPSERAAIWAVAKGASLNKVILTRAALLVSAFFLQVIVPLLMPGCAFVRYKVGQKGHHKVFHSDVDETEEELKKASRDREVDLAGFEKKNTKGSIRADLILSAEIIVIALSGVAAAKLSVHGPLIAISAHKVVGVHGLGAGIVKIDDLGVHLSSRGGGVGRFGQWLIDASPVMMKGLGSMITIAVLLVGTEASSRTTSPGTSTSARPRRRRRVRSTVSRGSCSRDSSA